VTDEFDDLSAAAAELGIDRVPEPVRVRTTVDGRQVDALRWGGRPRFTLLHGAALNAHTWDATLLALGEDALAVDLPGHGDSAWREDFDYRPATNARAVAGVLDALGTGPQVVVGQSLGGLTAVALAEQRPDLVTALVLIDASPGLRPGDARQVAAFLAGEQVFGTREEIVDRAVAAGIGSDRARLARGVRHNTRIRDDGRVVWKHHLAAPPAGAGAPDIAVPWAGLEDVDAPVLLVRATRGYLSDEVVAEFRERVPRATVLELETGHNVQEQDPVGLAAAIQAFALAER